MTLITISAAAQFWASPSVSGTVFEYDIVTKMFIIICICGEPKHEKRKKEGKKKTVRPKRYTR